MCSHCRRASSAPRRGTVEAPHVQLGDDPASDREVAVGVTSISWSAAPGFLGYTSARRGAPNMLGRSSLIASVVSLRRSCHRTTPLGLSGPSWRYKLRSLFDGSMVPRQRLTRLGLKEAVLDRRVLTAMPVSHAEEPVFPMSAVGQFSRLHGHCLTLLSTIGKTTQSGDHDPRRQPTERLTIALADSQAPVCRAS